MTDTFAYHPPGLSPARYPPTVSNQSSTSSTPHPQTHSPLFSHSRPSSSAGPYGLASLQEHPNDHEGDGGQDRPKLVGFEQLAGESDASGGLDDSARRSTSSHGGGGGIVNYGGVNPSPAFHNPFQRPLSPTSQNPSSATFPSHPSTFPVVPPSAHHAFFNPLPTVNTRNTRPMTAPSGPGYFHNSAGYSAAPSAFYAPQQQASTIYDSLHHSPNFQYHYDPHTASGSQFRPGTAGEASSFASVDGGSPSSSTPFFYAPPPASTSAATIGPTQLIGAGAIRTNSGTQYYPAGAILDPSTSPGQSGAIPDSLHRPNTGDSSVGPLGLNSNSTRRRSSTGSGKTYNFVQQAGQTTKRPRRRFDEIERLYNCDYPGCTKSYGTLNHLNSHKTMQKHGPKSTPAQFKEMRKAWRERKKAEAAAAAKARASEPPNPANLPTTTDPLGGGAVPGSSNSDRPRPSTSAGEYSFIMPAPFVVPPSFGGAPTSHSGPIPTALSSHPYGAPDNNPYQTHFPSPLHNAFTDPYSTRPVTAPSHFFPPVFGQPLNSAPLNGTGGGGTGIGLGSPHTFHSPTFNYPQSSPRFNGGGGGHDRRFSLPAPTLQNSFPSPESKILMPQPVLGYNPSALLNGSTGSNPLGFGLGLNNGKLSSHGGAAEDGTFGAIKEDVEGEDHHSSNLDDKQPHL
ncbi:uncharacterized protein JCM6883_001236 [Sporobolomyces salmoneus]|uniref:uncharacterized protein n=1 Tax=Sporobolomyces salmoneus TaxID=183962 RepID=UPI003179E74D